MIPNLERLDLQHCTRLLEVHQSVGFLRRLVVLNLNKCENLVNFPSDVCGLKSLQILNLHGCSKLDKLPLNLGEIKYLEKLDVTGTAIRQVPSSIVQLANLRILSFRGCRGPPETWSSFLFSLLLPSRKPDCMGLLLPPLAGLSSLQILDLSDCNLLEGAISRDVGSLYSLRELNISGNNFVSLPDTICQLSKLEILCLERCHRLQSLPKLPPGLLFVQSDDCTSLKTISSVLELTSPAIGLQFINCFNLVETRGSNKNSFAIMLLKHLLQISVRSNRDSFLRKLSSGFEFHICLPGNEIPKFFSCQNEGNVAYGRLSDGWSNDEFIGFVLCGVISSRDHSDGSMTIADKFVGAFSTIKSDHLWLAFLSRERLCDPHKGQFVHLTIHNGKGYLVKRCGIRPLYKHDVEYLEDLSATDVGISMGQELCLGARVVVGRILTRFASSYWIPTLFTSVDYSKMRKDFPVPLFEFELKYFDANSRGTAAGAYSIADQSHDDWGNSYGDNDHGQPKMFH